jgi:hypothetical protein
MRKLRFSIASLLLLILVLGVGFAALRESNDLWQSGLFTALLAILLLASLLAVHRRESERAYWLGFALCGWIYLGLTLVPSLETRLITNKALTYLDSKIPGRNATIVNLRIIQAGTSALGTQTSNVAFTLDGTQLVAGNASTIKWNVATGKLLGGWSGTTESFVRIGHTLLALLVAWLGGQLSRRLWRKSNQPADSAVVAVSEATS